jgi:hypothetical protein
MSRGRDSERRAERRSVSAKADDIRPAYSNKEELKPRRATYGDGITTRLTLIGAARRDRQVRGGRDHGVLRRSSEPGKQGRRHRLRQNGDRHAAADAGAPA